MPPSRVELTISNRTLLRVLAITMLFLFIVDLRNSLHTVLIELLISVFLAIALFLLTILVVVLFLIVIFTPHYNEVRSFSQHLPEYLDKAQKSRLFKDLDQRYNLLSKLRAQTQTLPSR